MKRSPQGKEHNNNKKGSIDKDGLISESHKNTSSKVLQVNKAFIKELTIA